jgi:hypothetical protein
MTLVKVNYADAGSLTDHKNQVVSNVNALIEQVIQARVSNEMEGERRTSAINLLRSQFSTNIAEITQALDYLALKTQAGMDGFQANDKPIG